MFSAVNQHRTGNRVVFRKDDLRVWTASSASGPPKDYLAIINLGDAPLRERLSWREIGFAQKPYAIHDVWTGESIQAHTDFSLTLQPHASALYSVAK